MAIIQIARFGMDQEGIYTFRVNSTAKEDLQRIIDESLKMGWKFWEEPKIEKVFKTYSVLMKIYNPKILYDDKGKNIEHL